MKKSNYQFQWFEREDGRRGLRASLGRDGKLRLGMGLRQALPSSIRVGFDSRQKVLAIADGHGAGARLTKCGVVGARALSTQVLSTGLRLPLSFRFVRDEGTGFFLGKVFPRRHGVGEGGRREYEADQLLILYQHVVDNAVRMCAKSMPLSERRACAEEAFHAAIAEGCPAGGDLEPYLEACIHRRLLEENKQYIAAWRDSSLDQPLADEGESFCLYDVLAAADSGGIGWAEERMETERFLAGLSGEERTLCRMLQEGYTLREIAGATARTVEELTELGAAIVVKRRAYDGEG